MKRHLFESVGPNQFKVIKEIDEDDWEDLQGNLQNLEQEFIRLYKVSKESNAEDAGNRVAKLINGVRNLVLKEIQKVEGIKQTMMNPQNPSE